MRLSWTTPNRRAAKTAFLVALIGLALGSFGLMYVRNNLLTNVLGFARHEAEEAAIIASRYSSVGDLRANAREFDFIFPEPGVVALQVWTPGRELAFEVRDPQLTPPVWRAGLESALRGELPTEQIEISGRRVARSALRVRERDHPLWVVVSVVDCEDAYSTFSFCVYVFLLILSATTLIVWLGSWVLLRIAARPLQHLVSEAQALVALGTHGPLTLPPRTSEMFELVVLFNRLSEDAASAIDRLKRFTSNVGHELRTPLTRMRGEAELALDRHDPAEMQGALESVLEEVSSLRSVVDALLELAREEASSPRDSNPISLTDVLSEIVEIADPLLQEKAMSIDVDMTDLSPIQGNRELISRALWNVLENAIKYSPPESTITVTGSQASSEAIISIRDEGPGVGADELEAVFEPFFRSADVARFHREGWGLGLPLARSIAGRHGGDLRIDSTGSTGTTFVFRFPSGDH